ncbi:Rac GTPase-activating protein 1 [Strongyloides ratti]|uniref:Rac GTPase-activating protein 1 n=1 Tax=Strongyloides ratti TaxID=34506 RepID=A0A090LEV6_STRRB|nr:Rac GTPase-activating protein 1 [Strongyloides ratti]CEF66065.1 Rac GTPase-activating protein 1 [Strongyloides ratti]
MDLSNSIHLVNASNALLGEAEEMMLSSDSAAIGLCQTIKDLLYRCQSLEDTNNTLEVELSRKDAKVSEISKELSVKDAQLLDSRTQIKILHKQNKDLETTSGDMCSDALALLSESDFKPRRTTKNRESEVLEDSMFDKTGDSSDDILPSHQPRHTSVVTNGTRKRSISTQPSPSQKRFAYAGDAKVETKTTSGATQNLTVIKENANDLTPVSRARDIPSDTTPFYQLPRTKLRRSLSETTVYSSKQKNMLLSSDDIATSAIDARSLASLDSAGIENAWASDLYSISCRLHSFDKSSLAMGYCDCYCGIVCHTECTERAPIPCVPRNGPYKSGSKLKLHLSEVCPRRFPMIPYIVVHCVVTLEKFYLTTEGLYRVPGSESDINRLYNAFLYNKSIPSFKDVDPETISGCLKKFLRELRAPVIPQSSWMEFVSAVHNKDTNALTYAIVDLPSPNLHTLAYLCLHWQKVAESSQQNKMPIENIAKVFGPTIVGFSRSPGMLTPSQMERETESQYLVMLSLLQLPECYWMQFFNKKTTDNNGGSKTPIGAMNTLKRNQLYHKTMCRLNQNDDVVSFEPDATADCTQGKFNNTVFSSVINTPPQGTPGGHHLSPRTIKRDLIRRDYVNKKYY